MTRGLSSKARCTLAATILWMCACGDLWGPWPGGIGAVLRYQARERALTVVEVPPATAAARAGMRRGDEVVAIDGAGIVDIEIGTVVERLRGPVGSHVRLTIVRNGHAQVLSIERAPYGRF